MKLTEFKPICGVYKITNTRTGKVYVGQSTRIHQRWATHVVDLVNGKHSNKELLSDFRDYGLECLEAEIIEECENKITVLYDRESYHIADLYNKGIYLYNWKDPKGVPYPSRKQEK